MRVNDNGRIWPECTEPRQVGVLKKFRSMSESVHFLSLLEKSNQFLPTWCWYFPSHLVAEPAGRNRFWVGRRGSVNPVVVWWKLLSGFHVRTYTYIMPYVFNLRFFFIYSEPFVPHYVSKVRIFLAWNWSWWVTKLRILCTHQDLF